MDYQKRANEIQRKLEKFFGEQLQAVLVAVAPEHRAIVRESIYAMLTTAFLKGSVEGRAEMLDNVKSLFTKKVA